MFNSMVCAKNRGEYMKLLVLFSAIILPSLSFAVDSTVEEFGVGNNLSCALVEESGNKNLICQGVDTDLFKTPKYANKITHMSVGHHHLCTIASGDLRCIGSDLKVTKSYSDPKLMTSFKASVCVADRGVVTCHGSSALTKFKAPSYIEIQKLAINQNHGCIIDKVKVGQNQLRCWGNNRYGKTEVPPLVNPVDVSLGKDFACAIDHLSKYKRKVVCWGKRDLLAVKPPKMHFPLSLSAGRKHICAIDQTDMNNTKLDCWGENTEGQIDHPKMKDPLLVRSSNFYTCAFYKDQGVECFGGNYHGEWDITGDLSSMKVATKLSVSLHKLITYFVGIHKNVDEKILMGWKVCYSDTYSVRGIKMSTILKNCSGKNIILACRPKGSKTLTLMASGKRDEVFKVTARDTTSGHDHNKVKFYFNVNQSLGFAPEGATLAKNSCDTQTTDGDQRLCWHTSGGSLNGGWRCGNTKSLGRSNSWERVIYQSSF